MPIFTLSCWPRAQSVNEWGVTSNQAAEGMEAAPSADFTKCNVAASRDDVFARQTLPLYVGYIAEGL